MTDKEMLDKVRKCTEVFGETPTAGAILRFRRLLDRGNASAKELAVWMDAHPAEVESITSTSPNRLYQITR